MTSFECDSSVHAGCGKGSVLTGCLPNIASERSVQEGKLGLRVLDRAVSLLVVGSATVSQGHPLRAGRRWGSAETVGFSGPRPDGLRMAEALMDPAQVSEL